MAWSERGEGCFITELVTCVSSITMQACLYILDKIFPSSWTFFLRSPNLYNYFLHLSLSVPFNHIFISFSLFNSASFPQSSLLLDGLVLRHKGFYAWRHGFSFLGYPALLRCRAASLHSSSSPVPHCGGILSVTMVHSMLRNMFLVVAYML